MKRRGYFQRPILIIAAIIVALLVIARIVSLFLERRTPQPTPDVSQTMTSSTPTASPSESPTPSPTESPSTSPGPAISPVNNLEAGKQAYQSKNYPLAITHYQAVLTKTTDKPQQAIIYNLLGNAYRENKNTTLALDSYTKATQADPTLISAYINKSNVYLSQSNKTEARKTLEAGLSANPENKDLEQELSVLNLSGTGAVE